MQLKLPLASQAHARLWDGLDHGTRLVVLDRLVAMMVQVVEVRREEEDSNDD